MNLNQYGKPKQLYVDAIKVDTLIKSNTLYTWLLCADGTVKRVSTYDHHRRIEYMKSI